MIRFNSQKMSNPLLLMTQNNPTATPGCYSFPLAFLLHSLLCLHHYYYNSLYYNIFCTNKLISHAIRTKMIHNLFWQLDHNFCVSHVEASQARSHNTNTQKFPQVLTPDVRWHHLQSQESITAPVHLITGKTNNKVKMLLSAIPFN